MHLGVGVVHQREAASEERQARGVGERLCPGLVAVEVDVDLIDAVGPDCGFDRIGHPEHEVRFRADRGDDDE